MTELIPLTPETTASSNSPDSRILWVSSVVGGATRANTGWNTPLRELLKRSRVVQEDLEEGLLTSPLRVNVVFHVPGPIARPDYEGVRAGSFARKYSILTVQVALPEGPPQDPRAYLLARVNDAVNVAEEWAARKSISVPLISLRQVITQLEKT